MKVYLDGQFVDEADARLSVFDAGVQHGVGLFETMHARGGKVFRLEAHIARLITSAKETGLTDKLRQDPLCEAVELTLRESGLSDARLRLTVTGGDLSLLQVARGGGKRPAQHQPTICITATEATVYPAAFFEQGIAAVIADAKANPLDPLTSHKTLNYWSRLRSLTQAAAAGAGEAIWLSISNHLAGGSVSNAFLVKGEQLFTPIARGEEEDGAIPSAVLPGITRAAVLEIAAKLDLPVTRKMLSINDVLEADELMLSNSSWGVLPVVRVERKEIGPPEVAGRPGPITKQIMAELARVVETECGLLPGDAAPPAEL